MTRIAQTTTTAPAVSGALVDFDFSALMAARRADRYAHCTNCRAIHEEIETNAVENGASMQRRDRRQLGLHIATPATAVSA